MQCVGFLLLDGTQDGQKILAPTYKTVYARARSIRVAEGSQFLLYMYIYKEKELTNNRYVHVVGHYVQELQSIHLMHQNVRHHKIETAFSFLQHVNSRYRIIRRRNCMKNNTRMRSDTPSFSVS